MAAKRDLNFELNLLPVISVLSVCTAFLLLTTVWINIGAIDIAQAYGESQEQNSQELLWVQLSSDGSVRLSVKRGETQLLQLSSRSKEDLGQAFQTARSRFPQLNSGLIQATAKTPYADIIRVMDLARDNSIRDMGVAPL